jgi:hypothetical protein
MNKQRGKRTAVHVFLCYGLDAYYNARYVPGKLSG